MIAICLDVGTSRTKCVAFDEDGNQVRVAETDTVVSHPSPGWSEQDMDGVVAAVAQVVREVVTGLDAPVDMVATTAQGDGLWLVDADGRPTGPALLWNDARSASLVDRWEAEGRLDDAFAINGSVGNAGLPNALLAWLHEHQADRVERAERALTCNGWVHSWLTGEAVLDESDACNPWFDVARRAYAPELLDVFDLTWARRLLPAVRDDDHRVGSLLPSVAEDLGLPAGLPVVLAPYDVVSTALGAGATRPGQSSSILGTTLCTQTVLSQPDRGKPAQGMHLCSGVPDRWLRSYATLCGTEAIDWTCRLLGLADAGSLSDLAASAAPYGSVPGRTPLLLPYLSPAGERAPFRDSRARGSWLGLGLDVDRPTLARAVFEGLAFVLRECLLAARVPVTELRVCGGGAASSLWCQVIADVTGVPAVRPVDTQSGAKGALVAACVARGVDSDVDSAARRLVRTGRTFDPDPDAHERYDAAYQQMLALRDDSRAHQWPVLDAGAAAGPAVA